MNKCKQCGKNITNPKFCNNSCAATYNNKNRGKRSEESKQKTRNSMLTSERVKEALKRRRKRYINGERRSSSLKGKEISKRIIWECPVCQKKLRLTEQQASKRKYCSGTCRNSVNNKVIRGTRSKAEMVLEQKIKDNFSKLKFYTNDRATLNGKELDFYFPDLKIAIEWNGIYHYKNIHKSKTWSRIKKNDKRKRELCDSKDIELIVVKDLTSSKKFIEEKTDEIIEKLSEHSLVR